MMRFDGQVAIVTGAGANPGLGRSYALLLAALGARVLVNDLGGGPDGRGIAPVAAETVAAEIRALGGEALADGHSVAESASAKAIVAAALDAWGRVDILINNAGINIPALFSEIEDVDIERTLAVHLYGTIWMCRAVWPQMDARGYGRIVNISSITALGLRHLAIYGTAKAGVLGLTRALAIEGAASGIVVNSLTPSAGTASASYVSVPADEPREAAFAARTPELVAPAAAFLAHADCPVTGRHLIAAGGQVSELYFARTDGYADDQLTLEDVAGAFDQIVDRDHAAPFPDPLALDATSRFRPKPYSPPAA